MPLKKKNNYYRKRAEGKKYFRQQKGLGGTGKEL